MPAAARMLVSSAERPRAGAPPLAPSAAVLLWVLAVPALAPAETLEQAWQLAAAHDQGLAAAQLDVQGADAQARAARGARWPSLDASAGYTRLNAAPELDVMTPGGTFRSDPLLRDNQFVNGSVQMRLPLYAGGQIAAGVEAAQHAAAGTRDSEQATGADLKLEVAQAYVDVLRARRALQVSESSVTSLSAHVSDAQALLERELVSRSDLLAARVALANAEQTRVQSADAVQLALAAYNRYLGEPLDRSPDLDEHLPVDATLAAQPLSELQRRALEHRPELRALSADADALAARARVERGKGLPQVALSGGYTHLDNELLNRENFATVGVGVSWSLFDGGQARNRAAALDVASRAAERRLEDLRSRIELDVRQAWLEVGAAQARLRASSEAVAQAEENIRTSRELYGAGMGSNTQVLDAVTLQVSALTNRDTATLDSSLTLLRLAHAIGSL